MPVALVTGASQGIGHAIALRLAEDGFDLAVNDIGAQKEKLDKLRLVIESMGRRSIIVAADISVEEEVNDMISRAVEALGNLTVMVANAGIMLTKTLMDITPDEWDRVQAVWKLVPFLSERGQQMIKQGGGGKIIGACSISGFRPVFTPHPRDLRRILSNARLTSNLLQLHIRSANGPGEMWDEIDDKISNTMGIPKGQAFQHAVEQRSAMKKPSTPEDIAGCVSFLASKDSNMITGQSVIIDGGIQFC
ncbi:acetoin reductase [Penicillium concentricum]|uniref:3-oxoacyl-[acyl-carrier-protein] reductase n=1 Tax=Penicillium concentricum TaxID=293559 RepID=A0A9X0B2B5_9EURO|nr:acetoin reductase [Penicillium concentricum]KAJ5385610.1 acetoin reductase [Penicillium concentricum]